MITAADEIFIDFSTSCTRNVAVAKLLGWMQGPIRRKVIDVTEDGISEDQLPYIHTMDEPLEDQLLELREAAQKRLYEAFEADDELKTDESKKVFSDAADEVDRLSQKIYKAAQYFRDIDDELARGDECELRVDKTATKTLNDPYIALSSLDLWAIKKYEFSIFSLEGSAPTIVEVTKKIRQRQGDVNETGDLGKVKAGNILTTLALFVEAFAKTAPKYGGVVDEPNVLEVAKYFSGVAFVANNENELSGQSVENIRKLISAALRSKKALTLKRT
ncbi:MAG: hypothetical protein HHJ17_18280 [Rhodoferax sp.]|uniref:hypothetical protein n=1 Tax=Rhodoferax sp. TaxID=50421 RepID=UPI00183D2B77|nr:hypothetical protein [Rhodoferax sp.]NMM15470.1 hypothetical protein [Rhodoferax sp.]